MSCLSPSCCSAFPPPFIMATAPPPAPRRWHQVQILGTSVIWTPFSVFHWASDPMWMSHGCPIYETQRMQLLFSNLLLCAHPCEWVHHPVLPLETQAHFLLSSLSSLHLSVSCLVMVSLRYFLKSHLSFWLPPLPVLAAASALELVSLSVAKLRSILLYISNYTQNPGLSSFASHGTLKRSLHSQTQCHLENRDDCDTFVMRLSGD